MATRVELTCVKTECVQINKNTHTHTQGCLKIYLDALHNKRLLVVTFKIYSFQIYARSPVFLPLLKLILELCVGWSITALEFQGHSGNNSLVVANA